MMMAAAVHFGNPLVQNQLEKQHVTSTDRPCSTTSIDSWLDYNLQWLFDPDRFDHLPIEEQLKLYRHNDLKKTRTYKFATKIFGPPMSRTRRMYAKPMHPTCEEEIPQLGTSVTHMQAQLKPQKPPPKLPTAEDVNAKKEQEKMESYYNWINNRKTFRADLETMGLQEDWLSRKSNKTALEHRVLARLIHERTYKPPPPPPPETPPLYAVMSEEQPMVRRPSPAAIKVIERYLHENQVRLIDLFSAFDRNKRWKVSRAEFREAIQEANIPISDVLLEDLVLALDVDLDNQIDYRELSKGMSLWKIEKREAKRHHLATEDVSKSPTKYSQSLGFEMPEVELPELTRTQGRQQSNASHKALTQQADSAKKQTPEAASPVQKQHSSPGPPPSPPSRKGSPVRIKSAVSAISSSSRSSSLLEPPPVDERVEAYILSSQEAMVDNRKRDRGALNRLTNKQNGKQQRRKPLKEPANYDIKTMVKTGDPVADSHLLPSTLQGETGDLVDNFRQLKFKEYNEIAQLCKEKDMPFTEATLRKVLLFPPDKTHREIHRRIRQPTEALLPSHFAVPPSKRPKSPATTAERTNNTKVKMSKPGGVTVRLESRQAYPSKNVRGRSKKMSLSTGRTVVNNKIDCWMTFDEYDKLTSHLGTRYTHGGSDENAFWPGQLLDKIRLCMPDPEPKTSSVFRTIRQEKRSNPGYHNDLRTWPVSESGYVQYGFIDPYKNKYI